MKTLCIYHSIDLDGWMSAAIVKHWWKLLYYDENNVYSTEENGSLLLRSRFSNKEQDRLDFLGYNYGQPIPDLSEYDRVILCDISFPKDEMFKLFERLNINFIWIDHHISAIKDNGELDKHNIEDISTLYNGLRRTDYAACELTWKYFMSNPIEKFGEVEDQNLMPEIVRLLGRYDCFGHKGTDEEQKVLEFQYGARQYISNYEQAYDYLVQSIKNNNTELEDCIWEAGQSIYAYLCTEAKQVYKNGFEIQFTLPSKTSYYDNRTPVKFICINKERFNPINFGIDYHKDGYDGAACFHYTVTDYKWHFSLYNDNGLVDCSHIAKQYGGGGHKGAAGFTLSPNEFTNLCESLFLK